MDEGWIEWWNKREGGTNGWRGRWANEEPIYPSQWRGNLLKKRKQMS